MRRCLAGIALVSLCAGCSTTGTTTQIRVPVAVPCVIQPLPRPVLAVDTLKADSDVFLTARALWSSLADLEGHLGLLEVAMQSCR